MGSTSVMAAGADVSSAVLSLRLTRQESSQALDGAAGDIQRRHGQWSPATFSRPSRTAIISIRSDVSKSSSSLSCPSSQRCIQSVARTAACRSRCSGGFGTGSSSEQRLWLQPRTVGTMKREGEGGGGRGRVAVENERGSSSGESYLEEEDDDFVRPKLPGDEPDFWEGEQWEWLGFILRYLWAVGIVVGVIGGLVAVRTYNSGATDYKATTEYQAAMQYGGESSEAEGEEAAAVAAAAAEASLEAPPVESVTSE